MVYIKIFFIIIFLCIIIFISFFLYRGATIYDLLIYGSYEDIYNKINKDTINILKKKNKINTFIFASDNDSIIQIEALLKINSLNNEIYFLENSYGPTLNIFKDSSILKTLLLKVKHFKYKELK